MTTFQDLKIFFAKQDFKLIIAADAETRISTSEIPAGGVAVSFDPIAQAAGATFIARAKTEEERTMPKVTIGERRGSYTLRRLFFTKHELDTYYYGFANQTLWPICHVAFERPEFRRDWFEGFKKVNQKFAQAIKEEIKGKTVIWLNDYQLSLVPRYLGKPKDTIIAMFWHIPWPTWEIFRILPFKREILESLLTCDFLAFHRGYHVRNFLETASRELEVRIDEETNRVYFDNTTITVQNLPMGIDTNNVKSLIDKEPDTPSLSRLVGWLIPSHGRKTGIASFFGKHKVILGVDRLDYTKGLLLRLEGIARFLEKYPKYKEKVVYIGIIAPSRETIPAYANLRREIDTVAERVNTVYARGDWRPINLYYKVFPRGEIINFYRQANLCLVTPRDDGMNLVSKEFVLAASMAANPGMLVLSRFAGSAIDLTAALIVNPYDFEEVADSIKAGLEMRKDEKIRRIRQMVETLEERNVYAWAKEFVENAVNAVREKRRR